MKKFLIVPIGLLVFGCSPKRPAVIERPVFDVWNSTTIEIDKIETSDSATIFHIDAYFRPNNWIRIAKDTYIKESGSNDRLLITHAEGINLDEETYMPESGTISFKLFFPPLKPEITQIDFLEGDCSGCFKIMGIRLLPDAKITFSSVAQYAANAPTEPLPLPGYDPQPARVSGSLLGYVDGVYPGEIAFSAENIITGEEIEAKLPVHEDGSFSGEIMTGSPSIVRSEYDNVFFGNVFLLPGKDVKMYIDLKKISRLQSRYRTDVVGDSAYAYISGSCFSTADMEAFNYIYAGMIYTKVVDYYNLSQEAVSMKSDELKQLVLGNMNRGLDEIKQKGLPANRQMLLENVVKLETYIFLTRYERFIHSAYTQLDDAKRADLAKAGFKPEKPDAEFYSFLKGEINDQMSYLPSYFNLVDQLRRLDCFNLPSGGTAKERFAFFKEQFAMANTETVLYSVIQAQYYADLLQNMKPYADSEKQEVRAAFKDRPAYADALIAQSDQLAATMAANKANKESIMNEPPQVSQEKMFDAILAKYKGKVVLVDFWATWCGPCMYAMEAIHPLKDEMKGKDVVFLYLTGETSPLNTWLQTYPTISGEHYRVSDAQWKYWYKTFGIEGIPTYMIYGKSGKQQARHLGFPGVEAIKKDIEKTL